jgi:hypothetical protein
MAPFSFAGAKIKSFFYTARLFEEKISKKGASYSMERGTLLLRITCYRRN